MSVLRKRKARPRDGVRVECSHCGQEVAFRTAQEHMRNHWNEHENEWIFTMGNLPRNPVVHPATVIKEAALRSRNICILTERVHVHTVTDKCPDIDGGNKDINIDMDDPYDHGGVNCNIPRSRSRPQLIRIMMHMVIMTMSTMIKTLMIILRLLVFYFTMH